MENLRIIEAKESQKEILQRLLELYQYDLSIATENDGAHSMAEFFVLKKYRRQGLGTVAAQYVINHFPGKWESRILRENQSAIQFWRQVINNLTSGRFVERIPDPQFWRGPVFSFMNGTVKSSCPKEFAE